MWWVVLRQLDGTCDDAWSEWSKGLLLTVRQVVIAKERMTALLLSRRSVDAKVAFRRSSFALCVDAKRTLSLETLRLSPRLFPYAASVERESQGALRINTRRKVCK
jgi:hypothetical protein